MSVVLKKRKDGKLMNKSFLSFIVGVCAGVFAIMIYLHRGVIEAAMAGEELPKAPKSCPAFRPEDDTQ